MLGYDHFSAIRGVSVPSSMRRTHESTQMVGEGRVSFDSDYSCEGGASLFSLQVSNDSGYEGIEDTANDDDSCARTSTT